MKNPSTPTPVVSFALPPGAGAKVQKAAKALAAAAEEYAAANVAFKEERGRKDDWKRIPDPDEALKSRRSHEQRLGELEVRRMALGHKVDEVGNELARAVDDEREEWLGRLESLEQNAADRYTTAIHEAIAAFVELQAARGAAEWLERFDLGRAIAGQLTQFGGGHLRISPRRGAISVNDPIDPRALLRFAGEAAHRPEPPKTSKMTAEEQARFAHA